MLYFTRCLVITLLVALLCMPLTGVCDEFSETNSVGNLEITSRWMLPDMDESSLAGRSDAADIIKASRTAFASFYGLAYSDRGIAVIVLDLKNNGKSEVVIDSFNNAYLIEPGGLRGKLIYGIDVTTGKETTEKTKEYPSPLCIPAGGACHIVYVFKGPSPNSIFVSLYLGTVQAVDKKELLFKLSIPQKVRDNLSSYLEKARGMAYMKKDDYSQAMVHYNKALSLYPGNPLFMIHRAFAYIGSGNNEKSLEDVNKAVNILKASPTPNPGVLEMAYLCMGVAYTKLGNDNAAAEAYRKGAEVDTESSESLLQLATLLANQNKFEEAKRVVEEAKKRAPDDPEVKEYVDNLNYLPLIKATDLLDKAEECLADNLTEDAIKHADSAVKFAPVNAEIILRASDIYLAAGYYDLALSMLRKLIIREPDDSVLHAKLAVVYQRKEQFEDAKKEASYALRLGKTDPSLHYLNSCVYYNSDCFELAVPELQLAIKLSPKCAELYAELAIAYELMEKDKEANKFYMEAHKRSPKNTYISFNYATFLHHKGDYAGALKQYTLAKQYRGNGKKLYIVPAPGKKYEIENPSLDFMNELITKAKNKQPMDE